MTCSEKNSSCVIWSKKLALYCVLRLSVHAGDTCMENTAVEHTWYIHLFSVDTYESHFPSSMARVSLLERIPSFFQAYFSKTVTHIAITAPHPFEPPIWSLIAYPFMPWISHPMSMFNPLTTNDVFWRRQILTTCYQLAQSVLKICTSRNGGAGGGGWVLHRFGWQCMAVVVTACIKPLVNAGWAIYLLSCTNGRRKCSFHLVRTQFLAF